MRFVCLLVLIISSQPLAKEVKAVTEHLRNFQFINDAGRLDGFTIELVKALAREAGYQLEIELMPWARAYKRARSEQNLLIFSIAKTPEREPMFNWVGTHCRIPLYLWAAKNHPITEVSDINALKAYSFAIINGSRMEQYLTQKGFTNLYRLANIEQIFGMLQMGRADFNISGALQMQSPSFKQKVDPSLFRIVYTFEDISNDLSIALSLGSDPLLVEEFQTAFAKLQQTSALAKLKEAWSVICL